MSALSAFGVAKSTAPTSAATVNTAKGKERASFVFIVFFRLNEESNGQDRNPGNSPS
jgi:hypothetical protein